MEKMIYVVTPPYFTRSQEGHLMQILLTEFGLNPSQMGFVIQPRAALAYCDDEERKKMNPGDSVTVCHMEEEITVRKTF